MLKYIIAALTGLALLAPPAAQAQDAPSYASQQSSDDANIRGRVTAFDGGYNLAVRDEKGYIDNVRLHPGTIINPTGLTLAPGMVVSVLGYNAGGYFGANEIDTPYQYDDGYAYYGGHPWDYYGPSVGLGFYFGGNSGWWHGGYFRGGYSYNGGARVYNSVRVNAIYNAPGGHFSGHSYVAPAEHGGYYGRGGGGYHGGGGHGGGGGAAHGGGGGGHGGGGHAH